VKTPFCDELIIMCLLCEFCNYRSTEVKTGGQIQPKGRKITLKVTCDDDLKLDLFKSSTCMLKIPELEFEYENFLSEGSCISTVQGLVQNIKDTFEQKTAVFSDSDEKHVFLEFLAGLNEM